MGTREETDLLGTKILDENLLYGIHTLRALENFNFSYENIGHNRHLIKGMILVKKACTLANGKTGNLAKPIAQAIEESCNHLLKDLEASLVHFPVDVYQGGAGTSVNMNVNEVIANQALLLLGHKPGDYEYVHPLDHVNRGQSTNDTYPSGFRMGLWSSTQELISKLESLQKAFEEKSKDFLDILKMGRTQLQDAVPMTLEQSFFAYAILIKEEVLNIKRVSSLQLELNLGATAIGTGINSTKEYTTTVLEILKEISGVPVRGVENLVEATSDTGDCVMLSGALKRSALKLSKICNDLRLLSSGPRTGLGEINLPELQAGSSIMPSKVNPVIPEVVNQICFKIVGNDLTVSMAAESGQLELNVMEPVLCQALFESLHLLKGACDSLKNKCLSGITANKEVCESYVFNSIGIVTYLSPHLGHQKCDEIGKLCAQKGLSVKEATLNLGFMSEEELDKILSKKNFLNLSR